MKKQCSHEDTRLSCTECGQPICSNCMIQCPVGFRCKTCVHGEKNIKTAAASGMIVAKCFGASALVGLLASWIIPIINVPFLSCFICFFLGVYGGKWVLQFIDPRLGPKTGLTVVFGALIGMSLGPLNIIPFVILHLLGAPLSGAGVNFIESFGGIVCCLFNPVCFFAGLLRPTVWGMWR